MSKRATLVAAGLDGNAYRISHLNPFGWGHDEAIKTRLNSKRIELHTVKIGVVQAFP